MAETIARRRASKVGVVVSDKADKTVVVRVDRIVRHKMYKRYVRKAATFMAHDEDNAAKLGDTVEIVRVPAAVGSRSGGGCGGSSSGVRNGRATDTAELERVTVRTRSGS
mgnify:CR=1 FL=1